MAKLPGGAQVDQALRNAVLEVKSALRATNAQAGKLLSKGDYGGADSLVEKARTIAEFKAALVGLRGKWKAVRQSGSVKKPKAQKTALWEYYQPILQALVAMDGEATAATLESEIERLMAGQFKPGDSEMMSGGPRWKVMIKRARRAMKKEGFLEANSGLEWRITAQGKKAASASPRKN